MPSPRRPIRTILAALGATALIGGLAACGDDPASAADQLAERARLGTMQVYTATYEVSSTTTGEPASVVVARTHDELRLDVETREGTATSITTAAGTVACQLPDGGGPATCLQVGGPGEDPAPAFDPGLRAVFTDRLRELAEPAAGRTVERIDDVTAADLPAACFVVRPARAGAETNASPDASAAARTSNSGSTGTYCLSESGIPVQVAFASGTATLTSLSRGEPPTATFTPPVSPTPLP